MTTRAAGHLARPIQRWSCAAAPIHDLTTGRILGVVDVTGEDDIGPPQTSAMIRAAARMAEAELARIAAVRPPWGSATETALSRLQAGAAGGQHCGARPPRHGAHGGRPDAALSLGTATSWR